MRRLVAAVEDIPVRFRGGVLIRGEPGSGKKHLARHLHDRWSDRRVFAVDCRLPRTELRSALGRAREEVTRRPTTIVLADVHQLDPEVQYDLLQLLRSFKVDCEDGWKLVATSPYDISIYVRKRLLDGGLADLLRTRVLDVPPLRERLADMPRLAQAVARDICEEDDDGEKAVSSDAIEALSRYPWPGNVAELRAALDHALVSARHRDQIEIGDLPRAIRGAPAPASGDPWPSLEDVERAHILATLQRHGNSRAATAKALKIHPNTLSRKLREYGVGRRRQRRPKGPSIADFFRPR